MGKRKRSEVGVVEFPENASVRYLDADTLLKKHPDLTLGHSACAVCARTLPDMVSCSACARIRYCTRTCLKRDRPVHRRLCQALAQVELDSRTLIQQDELLDKTNKLPKDVHTWMDVFPENKTISTQDRALSSVLSYPLTVKLALSKVKALANVQRIHVVGAGEAEVEFDCIHWKVLFPSTYIDFVGLQIPADSQSSKVSLHKTSYHDFVSKHGTERPDMIVFFHMGLSCTDYDWTESARAASSWKVPLLLTCSSGEEINIDKNLWSKSFGCSKVLADVAHNPFASLQIFQSGTLANDLYKKNAYWMVLLKS